MRNLPWRLYALLGVLCLVVWGAIIWAVLPAPTDVRALRRDRGGPTISAAADEREMPRASEDREPGRSIDGGAGTRPEEPVPAQAIVPPGAPRLALPIRCTPGRDCAVQFYPDADASDDIRDYRCGRTTYNTHRGTDIRVPTMDDVRRGVDVLAAAPGVVAALRDGEPDVDVGVRGRDKVVGPGRAGGNLVVLRHAEGWTSLYWHLREKSVQVRRGDQVNAGDVLGKVGLSGDTNFPHLHFELRHNNRHVDPFTGTAPGTSGRCGVGGTSLWTTEAAEALAYRQATLLNAGFSGRQLTRQQAYQGDLPSLRPEADSPALLYWWELSGVEKGDRTLLRIIGPDGAVFTERTRVQEAARGYLFDFVGRQRRRADWPQGLYRASLRHERDGQAVIDTTDEIEIK